MLASAVVRWNGELQRRDDLVRDAAVRDPGHVQVRVEHELVAIIHLRGGVCFETLCKGSLHETNQTTRAMEKLIQNQKDIVDNQ